jgi:hypothetical protein
VDATFKQNIPKNSVFAALNEGDMLPIEKNIVGELTNAAIRCGVNMIQFVDGQFAQLNPQDYEI